MGKQAVYLCMKISVVPKYDHIGKKVSHNFVYNAALRTHVTGLRETNPVAPKGMILRTFFQTQYFFLILRTVCRRSRGSLHERHVYADGDVRRGGVRMLLLLMPAVEVEEP